MPSRASGTQRQERDWRNRRRQTRVRVSDAQICLTQVTTVCRTTTEPKPEAVAAWEMGDGARTTTRLADVMGMLVLAMARCADTCER